MEIKKQTDNKFLNMYEITGETKSGKPHRYFFASRSKDTDALAAKTHTDVTAGVDIVAFYGDKIVLVKQYRYPIDGYIYECPAGLCEAGESVRETAVRETKEETGLDFTPCDTHAGYERAFYTSVGMSDEACATVVGICTGEISYDGLEDSEKLEIVLADRTAAREILAHERLSIRCALSLMRFVSEGPFAY